MVLDIHGDIVRQRRERLVQPGDADKAPRTNRIGEDVNLEGTGHAPHMRRIVPAFKRRTTV